MYNRRPQLMTVNTLETENKLFAGTAGISQNNRSSGFIPAFCDMETNTVEPSRFASGVMAPVHLFDGLPAAWIKDRDAKGHVKAVKGSVIAGFLHEGRFYTREQAAALIVH